MKFLADMGISPIAVQFLQKLGHHAEHLQEQRLHRLEDIEILDKARKEDAIILTHDLDFGDLLAARGFNLPSVVIFRLRNMRPENVIKYLEMILSEYTDTLKNGAIITVSETRLRVRYLPLETIGVVLPS